MLRSFSWLVHCNQNIQTDKIISKKKIGMFKKLLNERTYIIFVNDYCSAVQRINIQSITISDNFNFKKTMPTGKY